MPKAKRKPNPFNDACHQLGLSGDIDTFVSLPPPLPYTMLVLALTKPGMSALTKTQLLRHIFGVQAHQTINETSLKKLVTRLTAGISKMSVQEKETLWHSTLSADQIGSCLNHRLTPISLDDLPTTSTSTRLKRKRTNCDCGKVVNPVQVIKKVKVYVTDKDQSNLASNLEKAEARLDECRRTNKQLREKLHRAKANLSKKRQVTDILADRNRVIKLNHRLHSTVEDKNKDIAALREQTVRVEADLEKLMSELSAHEDQMSALQAYLNDRDTDRDYELPEVGSGPGNDSDSQAVIPDIKLRSSYFKINPDVIKCGFIMKYQLNVPDSIIIPIIVVCGRHIFGQKLWHFGNAQFGTRSARLVDNKQLNASVPKAERKKITCYTAPSHSYFKKQEPAMVAVASKQAAENIVNSKMTTLQHDGLTDKRKHLTVLSVHTQDHNEMGRYQNLAVYESPSATAEASADNIKSVLTGMATLIADDTSAAAVEKVLKMMLDKIRLTITDAGGNMLPTAEILKQWKADLDLDPILDWIRCNAHLFTSLDTDLEKMLMRIEDALGITDHVVMAFNKTFFRASQSKTLTMTDLIGGLLGPSAHKNQAWNLQAKFSTFMEGRGKAALFADTRCKRFGLQFELCFLIAVQWNDIKDFTEQTMESNRAFKSACLYMKCQAFKDICFAVGAIYAHLVRPLLMAWGCETVHGQLPLDHSELCGFYTTFIETLKGLTENPSRLRDGSPLPFLSVPSYTRLGTMPTLAYGDQRKVLFAELMGQYEGSVHVIDKLVTLVTESWWGTMSRIVAEVYLGPLCLIKDRETEDPSYFKGAPTTALSVERTVAMFRGRRRRLGTPAVETVSNFTSIKQSTLMKDIASVDAEDLAKQLTWGHKDPKAVAFRVNLKTMKERSAQQNLDSLSKSKSKRVAEGIKKRQLMDDVKSLYGGPMTNLADLGKLKKKFARDKVKLFDIVTMEIRYHRDIIQDTSRDEKLYRLRYAVPSGMRNLTLDEKLVNLQELLRNPSPEEVLPENLPEDQFLEKMRAIEEEVKAFNPARNNNIMARGKFVGAFFSDDMNDCVFPGVIREEVLASKCTRCKTENLRKLSQGSSRCYMIQFYSRKEGCTGIYELSDKTSWHTMRTQIIGEIEVRVPTLTTLTIATPQDEIDRMLQDNHMYKLTIAEQSES